MSNYKFIYIHADRIQFPRCYLPEVVAASFRAASIRFLNSARPRALLIALTVDEKERRPIYAEPIPFLAITVYLGLEPAANRRPDGSVLSFESERLLSGSL